MRLAEAAKTSRQSNPCGGRLALVGVAKPSSPITGCEAGAFPLAAGNDPLRRFAFTDCQVSKGRFLLLCGGKGRE